MVTTSSPLDFDYLQGAQYGHHRQAYHFIVRQDAKIGKYNGVDVIIGSLLGYAKGNLARFLAPLGRLIDISLRNTVSGVTAPSRDETVGLFTKWLSDKIRKVLGLGESEIDPNMPLHTYGLDSPVAIDLKNWFLAEIGPRSRFLFYLVIHHCGKSVRKQ